MVSAIRPFTEIYNNFLYKETWLGERVQKVKPRHFCREYRKVSERQTSVLGLKINPEDNSAWRHSHVTWLSCCGPIDVSCSQRTVRGMGSKKLSLETVCKYSFSLSNNVGLKDQDFRSLLSSEQKDLLCGCLHAQLMLRHSTFSSKDREITCIHLGNTKGQINGTKGKNP